MKKLAIFVVIMGIAAGAIAILNPGGLSELLGISGPPPQKLIPATNSPASAPLGTEHAEASSVSSAVAATNLQDALLDAIRHGKVEEVRAMLARGADAKAKDTYAAQYDGDEDGHDRTPLHYAVLYRGADDSATKIIELLISKGADVNSADADGAAPLHYAFATNAEQSEDRKALENIAAALIAHGANINAQHGMTGDTPLHMAASNDYKAAVELLLAKGADVNAKNHSGQTPLFMATDTGIAELLLEHGANANIKSEGGDTPLSFALAHNYTDLANALRAHGAMK
jgi:ankyrin repeat protein